MGVARNIFACACLMILYVCTVGCAATKYEWTSERGRVCNTACENNKYTCYADCGFGFRCEIACDEVLDTCRAACPDRVMRMK
jgi:hypothetical protein